MIDNLQLLRAVAALMVVCVHLEALLATAGVRAFGHGGVDLFFVISGFVMLYTTARRRPTPLEFMRNRVARVVPIYWLMTLAVFALAAVVPTVLQGTSADPLQLLKSLAFIPFRKASGLVQPTLFVGWTLNYEMFFYALFAVGLAFRSYRTGVFASMAVLGALVLLGYFVPTTSVAFEFYSNPRVLEFALGMALGLGYARLPSFETAGARCLVLVVAAVAFVLVMVGPHLWPSRSLLVSSGLPAAVVVAGAISLEKSGWTARDRRVLLLGDASYVIYLSHPFITQAFSKLGAKLQTTGVASLALVALAFAVVIAVGVSLHKWIERPLSQAARLLLNGRTGRVPVASRAPVDAKAP